MRALLHSLALDFTSSDQSLLDGWKALFDLEQFPVPESETGARDIGVRAAICQQPPAAPAHAASHILAASGDSGRRVQFHETPDGGVLTLARPAQIAFNFTTGCAALTLTREMVTSGNLEDLTLITIAPFLRRKGIYAVHAFAAASNSGAALFCGPSGSGKTSAGLAVVLGGWRFLANDAALLRETPSGIEALLSPGTINLNRDTLDILPALKERGTRALDIPPGGKALVPRGSLLQPRELGRAVPLTALYFPQIGDVREPQLRPIARAICLARLISDGVDQWDRDTFDGHVNFLTRLSEQTACFELWLPRVTPGALDDLGSMLRSLP